MHLTFRTVATASLLATVACTDPVVTDLPAGAARTTPFDCVASVRAASLVCSPAAARVADGARGTLILGGQGVYVRLASANTAYDGASLFTSDVTVQNLQGQHIGSVDGVNPDPAGIRVFFHQEPVVTGGSGTVQIDNEDGTAAYTGPGQPYFQYSEILGGHATSAPKQWRFLVQSSVDQFVFTVYVATTAPDEAARSTIDFDPRTLAVGGYHSCALTTANEAYCWGTNDDGQLGSASADSVPRLVVGGHSWRSLTAGTYHSCGITMTGDGYCWGDNQTGQLGNTDEDDSAVPVLIAGGHSWRTLDAGAGHTCGVTTSDDAYCWGEGAAGQLGDGNFTLASIPVAVAGGWKWSSVDAGSDHSCGITRGGAAQCWGNDDEGELGDGAANPNSGEPLLVAGNFNWKYVSAGEHYSCGISSSDVARCWGLDSSGQIGNGTDPGSNVPAVVSGSHTWKRITAGRETTCGITTSDAAFCWGFNNTGEIGDGSTMFTDAPTAVSGGFTWAWLDGGDYHTCGIRTTGIAMCWGYNGQGQLGDNSLENRPGPGAVSGGYTWKQ